MEIKKSKIHYAWYILAICILINVIVQSTVMQVASLYVVPMYNDLKVPRAMLSISSVLITVGAVLSAPFWGSQYKKRDARILLPLCITVTALCTAGRSLAPNIWAIYPISFIKGVFFTGSTLLPISILLTAWFKEKRGFAISVASIGTSIGGVILSPVVEKIISTYGWRVSDQIVGLAQFILVVPCVCLIVRNRPQTIGLLPYGAEKSENKNTPHLTESKAEVFGMTVSEAKRSPILYLFLLAILCMTFANGAALQIPAYLTDIGYGTAMAAKAVSLYSLIGIFGKLILGQVVDKLGEKKGTIYICTVAIIAYICFMFAINKIALYGMIFFYGLASGIVAVMPTLLTSKIFGNRDYAPIYGMVVSVNRFGGVIGSVLVSLLFDITGNYTIIWPSCVLAMIITLASIIGCMSLSEKKYNPKI